MNLASALIKQVLKLSDFDTWARVRKHYLPSEYHQLFDVIDKHVTRYHKLPAIEELKLSTRDSVTLDKVYALDGIETEAEPFLLLDYLKNEYAQKEALFQLDRYIDKSIAFETAEEVVKGLQAISLDIEKKVEIQPEEESMQKLSLFESEDEMARRITLGLNEEFDSNFQFTATDFILMGGRRGSGKSITCNNLCRHVINQGKTAVYFSIEMPAREVLQRDAAIVTKIALSKLRNRTLDMGEWERLAKWWTSRYENGEEYYKTYLEHRDFDKLHAAVSREELTGPQLIIIYDPNMTISKIRAELDKLAALDIEIGAVAVDYLNQIKRTANDTHGMYDWIQQIEISKSLRDLNATYKIPFFVPYQTDASGEARFAKGILDAATGAIVLTAHANCIEFTVTKMRHADDEVVFVSEMDWTTLTIGPGNAEVPNEEKADKKTKKPAWGKKVNTEIYDDPPF